MPFPENKELFDKLFNNESHWVVGYDAKEKNPLRFRITTTIPFFRKITYPIIFITGQDKKLALQKLLVEELHTEKLPDNNVDVYKTPCRIWREIPETQIFTDIKL